MKRVVTGLLLVLAVSVVEATPPEIEGAAIEVVDLQLPLQRGLEKWLETVDGSGWLGWQVAMADTGGSLCCWHRRDRGWQERACDLESSRRHWIFSSERPRFAPRGHRLLILVRAEAGAVDELRVYSEGCLLEATGSQVRWLENVDPRQSVALMGSWVEADSVVKEEALMTLALHAEPAAAARLAVIARQNRDPDLRGEALFWLSQSGSEEARDIILQALDGDPDQDVREEAVFALSQLPAQQGLPLLLEILQDRQRSREVREQAFFWYVQSGDDQALDLIAEILTN